MGHHYASIDLIGDGSYGSVYRSKDYSGNEYAIKQIPIDKDGIPCLLEAIIMSTFDNKVLNNAVSIFVTDKHLNLVQKLAKSDLAKHNLLVDENIKRKWMWQICNAVNSLHKVGIIHADIKPSNLLYFDDDTVKLADFTLSVKLWDKNDTFDHPIGTYAYCAPESLLGQKWTFPVDIWALGVTFYEIMYGIPLIKPQPKSSSRREIKIKYLNAIMTWLNIPVKNAYPFTPIEAMLSVDNTFDQMIISMLSFDAAKRPTIKDILTSSYFTGFDTIPTHINVIDYKPLSGNVMTKIIREIREIFSPSALTVDPKDMNSLIWLSSQIYQRLSLDNMFDLHLITCCWIATKLVLGCVIDIKTKYEHKDIIKMERIICRHLSYCLIPITRDFFN